MPIQKIEVTKKEKKLLSRERAETEQLEWGDLRKRTIVVDKVVDPLEEPLAMHGAQSLK